MGKNRLMIQIIMKIATALSAKIKSSEIVHGTNLSYKTLDSILPKHIITVSLSANITGINTNNYKPTFNVQEVVGSKLTLSAGKVLVGAGVSKVKVSATAFADSANTGNYLWLAIIKNTGEVAKMLAAPNGIYKSASISDRVISVNQGDTFTLNFDNTGGFPMTIRGDVNTWLTVEVIE